MDDCELMRSVLTLIALLGGVLLLIMTGQQAALRRQSPDTARLAFVHDYTLYLGFSDGSVVRPYPIDAAVYATSFGPSGDWIVLATGQIGDFPTRLVRHNLADGSDTVIASNDSSYVSFPRVSPNGRYVAFIMGSRFSGTASLYVATTDGKDLFPIPTGNFSNNGHAWTPDSRAVIFNGRTATGEDNRLQYDVTTATLSEIPVVGWQYNSFNPTGDLIVHEQGRQGSGVSLGISRMDGAYVRELTAVADEQTQWRYDSAPLWSSDGQWIYYSSYNSVSNGFDLYRIRPDRRDETRLTTLPGDEFSHSISASLGMPLHLLQVGALGGVLTLLAGLVGLRWRRS